jgi:methyl-accepting chemotaxis protein
MRSIETAARHITEIVAVIDGIAFKTNLLALNAAVEAARAGEHGRGFGVVAAEVRQLAQSAAKAAGQIRELSSETSSLIRDGAISVGEANGAMSSLVDAGQAVAETVNGVSSRSVHQSEVLVQIDEAVLHLDSSTQQNAALAEQLAAASTYLQQRASELQELISVFSIGDSSANESQRADVHDAPVSVSEAGTT